MPVRPVLMVLYTNDAVEVRYTDGSRLHILPCGSAFSYYVPQDAHPIHGKYWVLPFGTCCNVLSFKILAEFYQNLMDKIGRE